MSDSTQNPPPSQPMGTPAGVGVPADLLNRFLARLIDFVLLGVVNGILVSVVVVGAIMGSSAGGFGGFGTGASFAAGAVSAVLTAAIYLGYFAFMESSRGQTIGKMLLKLETRGPDGGKPTMDQAVKRNAFTAIGLISIIPILGWFLSPILSLVAFIMIAVTINNNTATRQGWHDQFAGGTSVIKIG